MAKSKKRHPYFDPEMGYNPKYGYEGRVTSDDFSIDGKAWAYRDPDNKPTRNPTNRGDELVNENALDLTNPLYDYSYGATRDAAEALGINNVNSRGEVEELLAYLGGDRSMIETPSEPEPAPEPEPDPEPLTNEGAVKGPGLAYAEAFADQYLSDMASGASNVFSDDYRSTGDALAQRGITPPGATFDSPTALTTDDDDDTMYGDEGLDLSSRSKASRFLDGYLPGLRA